MQTLAINGHTIVLYDSIHQLPINRYNAMEAHAVRDAGIGSTMADVERHFANLDQMMARNDMEAARQERINLHYSLYFNLAKINHTCNTFICLIHSIDGNSIENIEDDSALDMIRDTLSAIGVTENDVRVNLEQLKKNLIGN